jgi:hypothetical protein
MTRRTTYIFSLRFNYFLPLRADHWLAKKKEIRCADLSSQNFILYYRRDGKSPLDGPRKAIAEKGAFRLDAVQKAQSITIVIGLVLPGQAWRWCRNRSTR